MFAILHALGMFVADMFKSRWRLEAENLFLRHQLNIALRQAPPRLRLRGSDRALLVGMTKLWPSLSFPKILSGLDSPRAAESSHDLGRCLQSCTRSERYSSICSSREAGLAPRICFSAISSPLHCGGRRLVVPFG